MKCHKATRNQVLEDYLLIGKCPKYKVKVAHVLRSVQLFVTPWTVVYKLPLSLGFSGKNSGVGSSQPRDRTCVSCTEAESLALSRLGSPKIKATWS